MSAEWKYVLGFVFDVTGERVLLQLKRKPDWQRNRFNGIGGHIESGEEPRAAMEREAGEECGLGMVPWQSVCKLTGPNFEVHVFASFTHEIENFRVPGGAEVVHVFKADDLPPSVIPNLRWLIPMALSLTRGEKAKRFEVTEVSE